MFKVEVFIDNVYQGEFPNSYKGLAEARVAINHDREIYCIENALYLISFNGKMTELWELANQVLTLKKEYI